MPYKKIGLISTSADETIVCNLISFLSKLDYKINALWCANQERAIHLAADKEIPFVAVKIDDLLLRKDVELVIVTGQPARHAQIAVKALGIGKHVLCASAPAAVSRTDALKMVEASRYYPQLLALVGFGLRQHETYDQLRKLIAKQLIGTPLTCEIQVQSPPLVDPKGATPYGWLWEQTTGGGVLTQIGAHLIDLTAFLFDGRRANRVQGHLRVANRVPPRRAPTDGGFRRLNADDYCSFTLFFGGDSDDVAVPKTALISVNAVCTVPFRQRVRVCGTDGYLLADGGRLLHFRNGDDDSELLMDAATDDNTSTPLTSSAAALRMYDGGVRTLLRQIATAVVEGGGKEAASGASWQLAVPQLATVAGFEDVLYVQSVIAAVRKSSQSGETVCLDG